MRIANGDGRVARLVGTRTAVGALLAASALVAITAATALPSAGPSTRATAAPPVQPARYVGATAQPTSAVPPAAADADISRFTGVVGPDLSRALTAAGVPETQGREYVALLNRAIRLSDGLSVADRFDLVLLRNRDGSLGPLVYAGMDRVARADVELMKWTDGREIIWVNADGVGGDGSQSMEMPVNGRLTSGFGSRFHPILGYRRFHAGLDLAAAAGTPIVAAADGKVVSAGWAGGYGRAVAIVHASGIETKYGHMSRIAAYAGEVVRRGDVIGYVGSSGLSTGPHLHFEVLKNGRPVNPQSVKDIAGGPGMLQGAKLAAFHDQLRKLLLG
jgi:murein DD-endopeptidase MepM/ murein hydrolase activator NlpD